jgi:hypothetical protein
MAASAAPATAGLARHDLGARQAIALAVLALAVVTVLDVTTDGRLGSIFSIGFVLVVLTVPLAVDVRSLLPAGVLPPVLLVVLVGIVAAVSPDAVDVPGLPEGTGWFGRTLTGTIDRGVTLMVGHGLALLAVVTRILTDPQHPRRTRRAR